MTGQTPCFQWNRDSPKSSFPFIGSTRPVVRWAKPPRLVAASCFSLQLTLTVCALPRRIKTCEGEYGEEGEGGEDCDAGRSEFRVRACGAPPAGPNAFYSLLSYRTTRAPLPFMTDSTSFNVAMLVSPGVVIAMAPCAAPYSTACCGVLPARKP